MGRAARGGSGRIAEDALDLLRRYAESGVPCALATVVRSEPPASARPGDKAVVTADGRLQGWIGGSCSEPVVRREALRALAQGTPQLVRIAPVGQWGGRPGETRAAGELTVSTTCPSGGTLEIFIEPRLPKPLLLVFGETPAAETLARLGELIGFRARTVGRADVDGMTLHQDSDAWAVVATMGHYDEEALEAVLAHPHVDVALVASARRAAAVKAALRSRGLDGATLDRIRTPAGRVRGATQQEIALLALAEVVAARRLRATEAPASEPIQPAEFATDPVCGMAVDPLSAREKLEHGGSTHWFCCSACRETFAADPERYSRPPAPTAAAAS